MAVKTRNIKADEREIESWEKAAEIKKEDGRTSFNHWARKLLNREMRKVFRKNGVKL